MITVVAFKGEHLVELLENGAQSYLRSCFSDDVLAAMEKSPFNRTAIDEAGMPIACAGVSEYWPNRAEAWAFLRPGWERHRFSVHKAVKHFLSECPVKRVEASVEVGFIAGHRWVEALGFKMEAPFMEAYQPNGADCSLYSRVK